MTVQEDYQPVFMGKVLEELQTVLQRYPNKQAALLPTLWLAQREHGWISDRIMAEVADVLGLTPAYVKGVVTFYTMYHQHPVGKKLRAGVHDVAVQHLRRRGRAEGTARTERRR